MNIVKILIALLLLITIIYWLGPRVTFPKAKVLDKPLSFDITKVEQLINTQESKVPNLKPNNQARIVWANDSLKQQTEYCLVYLHGFSASQEEGSPVHTDFAKRYGMNLYLTRLEDHGRLDTNSFINLTPDNYLQSAEDAIRLAKTLGKKVIVMSCSTGSTLAAIIAAAGEDITALIMYSPNIDIFDRTSDLLLYPWGKQISEIVLSGQHHRISYDSIGQVYWNSIYHTNGIFAMKTLIADYMNEETFAKITIPTFVGYYYKDEDHQDNVVSVPRILEFYEELGTKEPFKKLVAFPEAGHHVVCSHVISKDIQNISKQTYKWAEEVLNLLPISK